MDEGAHTGATREATDAATPALDVSDHAPTARLALAGAAATAVALGVAELVSGLSGGDHSLLTAVGTSFIDRFSGPLKEPAVRLFGTADKPALTIGMVVVTLALGAVVGVLGARRRWLAPVAFGAAGLVGVASAVADPLASVPFAVAGAALGVLAGVGTLRALSRLAVGRPAVTTTRTVTERPIEYPSDRRADRRQFFGWAGAAGAFALVAGAAGRAAGSRSNVEAARSTITLPRPTGTTIAPSPADGMLGVETGTGAGKLSPYLTPNDAFYRIDTALLTPQVDLASWRLKVAGLVDRPFELSYADLLALPQVEETVTLSCVSNEVGGELVGNAAWTGVPLSTLLERAGVQAGAGQLVGISVDGFTAGFPTSAATDGRVALVAVGMNGEPLPADHGFPARLVVEGLYGYVSATKWLSEIRLSPWEGVDGYWIPRGWAKEAPIKTQSRIDVPRGNAVPAGRVPIAGVAWAPGRGVSKVEVQVDDGPWQEARLGEVRSDATWRQWMLPWDATPGRHRLRVRATDGTGQTQTEAESRPDPDGATGWHERTVTVVET
ncbi:MAG: molybdopterin-dependent oxidoreductase [Acidimicrobiales bacterium]